MANLGQFTAFTQNKYVKVADIINVPLQDGMKYIIQATKDVLLVGSADEPTDGGFLIPAYEKTQYEKNAGSDLWINTIYNQSVEFVISEN